MRNYPTTQRKGGLKECQLTKQREEALYLFANGSSNILVSTDLSSRGIDIPGIQNIIHYHLPETRESYIHRIGRTARWDAEGTTFFIISPEENIPEYVEHSEEYLIILQNNKNYYLFLLSFVETPATNIK